jgi:excisionase family DNA binding protein
MNKGVDVRQLAKITTVTKAAERLGCSRQNVLYLLAKGRLTGTLIGPRCWAVDVASVEAYKSKRA